MSWTKSTTSVSEPTAQACGETIPKFLRVHKLISWIAKIFRLLIVVSSCSSLSEFTFFLNRNFTQIKLIFFYMNLRLFTVAIFFASHIKICQKCSALRKGGVEFNPSFSDSVYTPSSRHNGKYRATCAFPLARAGKA